MESAISPTKRRALMKVMATMRQNGFLARSNYMCCLGCASSALALKADQRLNRGEKLNGAVYWHRQDEDWAKRQGDFYIAYGDIDTQAHPKSGMPALVVGKLFASELAEAGVKFEWTGDECERIHVFIGKEQSHD